MSTGRRGTRDAKPSKSYHPSVNAILAALRSIPRGRVAAYGQVALVAGLPRGARQVSRVLHSLSEKERLPWHRVLNRNGFISLPLEGHGRIQAALLRKEGVAVDEGGRVDLSRYGWKAGRGSR